MTNTPYFLTNPTWFRYETHTAPNGMLFERFELTASATPSAIDSFKQTMLSVAQDSAIEPDNLNRFQQALAAAEKQFLFEETNDLSLIANQAEQILIASAIRTYQLLEDDFSAPTTFIFQPRIRFLYRRFLNQHNQRINDETLNNFIITQDKLLK
ncbi:substrate-binding protein [Leuconostoc pseudomesenteroides]|uniref:substrate-binding protein n=1 Tax=Leuconostoc pseudomesenteroides TaxID=33968 RepID=UPI00345E37F1